MDAVMCIYRWVRTVLIMLLAGYGGYNAWTNYGAAFFTEQPTYPEEFAAGEYHIGPQVKYSPLQLVQMCYSFGPYCYCADSRWTLYVFTRAHADDNPYHLVISGNGQDLAHFAIPGLTITTIDSAVPPAFRSQPPPDQLASW